MIDLIIGMIIGAGFAFVFMWTVGACHCNTEVVDREWRGRE